MPYKETCEHCGSVKTAYIHALNLGIVQALCDLHTKYRWTGKPVNVNRELNMTHNQAANFQKLRYWGLVQSVSGGKWVPTELARQFIEEGRRVYDRVATFDAESLPYDHEVWEGTKPPKLVDIQSYLPTAYKQRSEYQAEKCGNISMF